MECANSIMKGEQQQIALITGSSSGIGFETALLLARNGIYTYATMRNLSKSEEILASIYLMDILCWVFVAAIDCLNV
jgi:NAD(P)-dependent dehydrogenase (short-subunit alcohol dehydrogenase family)